MRIHALSILAFMSLAACGGETSATDPAETSTSTMMPPDCTPGSEGCACDAGTCASGLACYSDICVMPPASPTTSTTDPTEDPTSSDASTSSDPSTSSGDPGTETSTTGDDADGSSTDTTDGSTTDGLEACEREGNNFCADGEIQTCTGGTWNVRSCLDECGLVGLDSTGCADVSSCHCEGYLDQTCIDASASYCSCYSLLWGETCEENQIASVYEGCFNPESYNHPFVSCLMMYPSSTYDECVTAWTACD
jgi:hypothetical protein